MKGLLLRRIEAILSRSILRRCLVLGISLRGPGRTSAAAPTILAYPGRPVFFLHRLVRARSSDSHFAAGSKGAEVLGRPPLDPGHAVPLCARRAGWIYLTEIRLNTSRGDLQTYWSSSFPHGANGLARARSLLELYKNCLVGWWRTDYGPDGSAYGNSSLGGVA